MSFWKFRGENKKIGESVEERRRGVRAQMQLACVPMKIRERDGGARVCRRGASERASFLLHAAISHGSSCFGFSCDCRVAVIDAGFSLLPLPPPRFPLSLTRCSRVCLWQKKKKKKRKKKEKQATKLEFKGRRSSWPGSYWSRQYSSNEVSRSIGNWCCNRCNLPVLRFIRLPFCPVGLSRREAALFAALGTLLLLR